MNNPLARDMIEATRLTQAGRLNEATALLQKLLRGDRFPSTESQGRDTARAAFELPAPTIDVVAEIKDIADVEAFSVKEPPSGTDGIQKHAGLHLAGPLRDVFDRFNLRGVRASITRIAQALAAAPVRYRTDWRNVRGKIVLRRSGKPRLQALHNQPLLWWAATPDRHAARVHPIG